MIILQDCLRVCCPLNSKTICYICCLTIPKKEMSSSFPALLLVLLPCCCLCEIFSINDRNYPHLFINDPVTTPVIWHKKSLGFRLSNAAAVRISARYQLIVPLISKQMQYSPSCFWQRNKVHSRKPHPDPAIPSFIAQPARPKTHRQQSSKQLRVRHPPGCQALVERHTVR